MVHIIFESHSTTIDNEAERSSGHYDVELSELGLKQSKELGERYSDKHLDAIYCSDLQRSYKTGEIAFEGRGFQIIRDARLRECDYGDMTQFPSPMVSAQKTASILMPFPNGESYSDCINRMGSFLQDILKKHQDNDIIMVIGHRATQYGLNYWISGHDLTKCVTDKWKWQPGWNYKLTELKKHG